MIGINGKTATPVLVLLLPLLRVVIASGGGGGGDGRAARHGRVVVVGGGGSGGGRAGGIGRRSRSPSAVDNIGGGGTLPMICPSCDKVHCMYGRRPERLRCRGGVTRDVCNCCPKCAVLAGEPCGGVDHYLGRCDVGLVCEATPLTMVSSSSAAAAALFQPVPGHGTSATGGDKKQATDKQQTAFFAANGGAHSKEGKCRKGTTEYALGSISFVCDDSNLFVYT